jgi:hypothetical protein
MPRERNPKRINNKNDSDINVIKIECMLGYLYTFINVDFIQKEIIFCLKYILDNDGT